MDPRLLHYYNQELQHLHEMGAEFAQQFPKIAARLGMDGIEVADPYVERLMEGAGFMAARVQVKLDAEFPRFTQRLLEIIYPNYLAPTPAMLITQMQPQLSDANLAKGFTIPRDSSMRNQVEGDQTPCQFRTTQDVTLWPIELTEAKYFSFAPDLPLTALPIAQQINGGLRLKLRTTAGLTFDQIDLEQIRIFLSGSEEISYKLHELCFGHLIGALVMPADKPSPWYEFIEAGNIRPVGYQDEESLLPATLRNFQGYRLIQEYYSFPQRFLFMDIGGLGPSVKKHTGNELEVILLFERGDSKLESMVDQSNFSLFCTPAINLFPKRADRIHLGENTYEYHVVPDRTRPMDYEIYDVTSVVGYGVGSDSEQPFLPFYTSLNSKERAHNAYFTLQRQPRLLSTTQKQNGLRSSYIGSEVFISLVDPEEAPFSDDLRQLSIATLCTNRDLPIQMPLGGGKSDFALDDAAPLEAIRCVAGPSKPLSPLGEGEVSWRFINHLSLNYLSLINTDEREGAATLREMLKLYANRHDTGHINQIEGVRSVSVKPLVRRLPAAGPICFGRGLEVELEVDELAFQGGSAFLFGCVIEKFFAHHVSINSFTETVLRSTKRGEIMRWVPQCGNRPIL